MAASSHGGAGNGPTPTATRTDAAHGQLSALLTRRGELAELIERAAAEVVRAWMIDSQRALLTVDISRSLPDYPANEALAEAVGYLPDTLFRWGLDIRGHYTVRLSDLNEQLGRDRGDWSHTTTTSDEGRAKPRIEIVGERDPDGGTDIELFIDGQRGSFEEHMIDAGYGHEWSDWVDSRACEIASASDEVAAVLYDRALDPCGGKYIDNMPADLDQRARELDMLIEHYRKGDVQ